MTTGKKLAVCLVAAWLATRCVCRDWEWIYCIRCDAMRDFMRVYREERVENGERRRYYDLFCGVCGYGGGSHSGYAVPERGGAPFREKNE